MNDAVILGQIPDRTIYPRWIEQSGACPPLDPDVHAEDLVFCGDNHKFRFRSDSQMFEIEAGPKLLKVSSEKMDCGAILGKMMRLFPHLVLDAIGHNFVFEMPKERLEFRPSLNGFYLEDLENLVAMGLKLKFDFPDFECRVEFHEEKAMSVILVNWHANVFSFFEKENGLERVIQLVESFKENQEKTAAMIERFFLWRGR